MHSGSIGIKLPGFYIFGWQYQDIAGTLRDCAVCFKSPGEVQPAAWAELIEEISKGPELPDAVLLMYLQHDVANFTQGRDDINVINSLIRFEKRFPCFQLEANLGDATFATKLLGSPQIAVDEVEWSNRVSQNRESLIQAGLNAVFDADSVVIEAPAGFEFVKHAEDRQSRSRVFLRAEQALTDTAVVSFVAFCIWLRLLSQRGNHVPTIKAIYVDTMGISPVAFSLREFFGQVAGPGFLPQVESFHSYGGLDRVRVADKVHTLCLISASTSMNMHRSWKKLKGVNDWQVLTLVTSIGAADASNALVALDDKRLAIKESASFDKAPYCIRIKGETFVPDLEGAKPVLIGLKHSLLEKGSLVKDDASAQSAIYSHPGILVYGAATDSNPTYKPVFIDEKKIAESQDIAQFMFDAVDQYGYAKAKTIIYQDDIGSRSLAERVAAYLSLSPESLLVASEVSNTHTFHSQPILVIAGVVGQGSQLIGVSRDLRGKHKGNRMYLVGVHLPVDYSGRGMLARNLEKTKQGEGVYRFKAFCSLPVGASGAKSFLMERSLAEKYPAMSWPAAIKNRFDDLSKNRLNAPSLGLLPTGINLDQTLRLREGFTFWTKHYLEGSWIGAVLWTIGAILQRAREDSSLPLSLQLKSTALSQVYLDPENFTRYNDGIIQGAFLRMALDHELDYRGQKDASNRMQRFLTRMFRNITDLNSEAALEFLCALATRRLQLEQSDIQEFVKKASELVRAQPDSPLHRAIDCFFEILNTEFSLGIDLQEAQKQPF